MLSGNPKTAAIVDTAMKLPTAPDRYQYLFNNLPQALQQQFSSLATATTVLMPLPPGVTTAGPTFRVPDTTTTMSMGGPAINVARNGVPIVGNVPQTCMPYVQQTMDGDTSYLQGMFQPGAYQIMPTSPIPMTASATTFPPRMYDYTGGPSSTPVNYRPGTVGYTEILPPTAYMGGPSSIPVNYGTVGYTDSILPPTAYMGGPSSTPVNYGHYASASVPAYTPSEAQFLTAQTLQATQAAQAQNALVKTLTPPAVPPSQMKLPLKLAPAVITR